MEAAGRSSNRGSTWRDRWSAPPRTQYTTETKPFFLTSEFLAFLLAVAAILIAVWQAENFEAPRAWLYVTIVAAAYIVSRGIAKAGTRDPNPNRGGQGGYGQ